MHRGRSVSESFKQAVFAQETEEVFLLLLTIHADPEIRLVNNTQNIVSRQQTYYACPILIELPLDADEQMPVAKITIDNLDKVIIAALRSLSEPVTVSLELIRASSPDTVEAAYYDLSLKQVHYDYTTITGVLTYEDVFTEPWPAHEFSPGYFPGLF